MHPIIKCKVQICKELIEAENINACAIILDEIMERPTASQREKDAYEKIINMAYDLSMQIIAEEKVKYQKMQKDQEMLIKKQFERAQQSKGFWTKCSFFNPFIFSFFYLLKFSPKVI